MRVCLASRLKLAACRFQYIRIVLLVVVVFARSTLIIVLPQNYNCSAVCQYILPPHLERIPSTKVNRLESQPLFYFSIHR